MFIENLGHPRLLETLLGRCRIPEALLVVVALIFAGCEERLEVSMRAARNEMGGMSLSPLPSTTEWGASRKAESVPVRGRLIFESQGGSKEVVFVFDTIEWRPRPPHRREDGDHLMLRGTEKFTPEEAVDFLKAVAESVDLPPIPPWEESASQRIHALIEPEPSLASSAGVHLSRAKPFTVSFEAFRAELIEREHVFFSLSIVGWDLPGSQGAAANEEGKTSPGRAGDAGVRRRAIAVPSAGEGKGSS